MIAVECFNDHPRVRIRRPDGRKIARRVLRAEGGRDARLRIIYTGDGTIRALHREHLGRDRVTDVITFPIETGETLEAEIYINVDQAARQAADLGISRGAELARLIVHGVLHLAGHDDRTARLRKSMRAREDFYLSPGFSPGAGSRKPAGSGRKPGTRSLNR